MGKVDDGVATVAEAAAEAGVELSADAREREERRKNDGKSIMMVQMSDGRRELERAESAKNSKDERARLEDRRTFYRPTRVSYYYYHSR